MVSIFKACYDSTPQVYPGMEERAYLSARAILQIKASARARSRQLASRYTIPVIYPERVNLILQDVIHDLEDKSDDRSTPYFPTGTTDAHTCLLWMSKLVDDLTGKGPYPSMSICSSCFDTAPANHKPAIAEILLAWYMFLGGHVEEETFWTVDKSCALARHPSFQSTYNYLHQWIIRIHPLSLVYTSDECHC